ncbi:MAG: hypothetical protein WB048_17200 [Pseudolabrys sp.]
MHRIGFDNVVPLVVSGNAVIQLSATDSITLVGVDFNDLHQTDFII